MKSICELTKQRNRLQEWLINSGSWKRHPLLYRYIENAWQRYVNNIEKYYGDSLVEKGLNSNFAKTKVSKSIYMK